MPLEPNRRIGPYEVIAAIGAGGMGEVYRARDTKLGRDVALKVLPDEFTHDPDRLARFEREAHVLAALNHPHIAVIHGLEDAGETRALVMELVPGATLSERMSAAGALDLAEALPIARQIALALEAAHERGIVHRDLKPANIKVRDDGVVKVLDFGLAKEVTAKPARDIANSPTMTTPAQTARGELLGTAAYMSPEQARGKQVDKRTDIWAFGVVLHEMLSGRRLFRGESATDVIAQVLTRDPDSSALPNDVPASIRTLLRRCLTRDPNNRLRDIGEARVAIDEYIAHPDQPPVTTAVEAVRPSLLKRALPVAGAALGGVVAGIGIGIALRPVPVANSAPVTLRTSISLPAAQTLTPTNTGTFALSPDGRLLAYKAAVGRINRLYVRDMQLGGEPREIPDTEAAESFTFSPQGDALAFSAKATVRKVLLAGGTAMQLCTCTVQTNMYWAPDGFIYFAGYSEKKWSLRRMPAAGGGPKGLQMPADFGDKQLTHPSPLPGGRRLLVVVSEPGGGEAMSPSVAAYDLETFAVTPLIPSGTMPVYLPTGYLMFAKESVLYAAAFDAATLKLTGQPAPVVEHVGVWKWFGQADYAVAHDAGTMVYGAVPFTRSRVVRFKADLAPEPVIPDARGFLDLNLSADGRHLAVTIDPRGIPNMTGFPHKADLFTRELALGDLTRRATGEIVSPFLFPDGQRLAFGGGAGREWSINLGSTGGTTFEPIVTLKDQNYPPQPYSVTPDGKLLAYHHNGNLYVVPLEGDRTPREFLKSRYSQTQPAFSPDGRWIAYTLSDGRGGADDIWVRPYPGPEPAVRISTQGGSWPRWSGDGKRIFFVSGNGMVMATDVVAGKTFQASAPRQVTARVEGIRAFTVSPDGEIFYAIVNEFAGPPPKRDITVVTGWFDEVRRLISTR